MSARQKTSSSLDTAISADLELGWCFVTWEERGAIVNAAITRLKQVSGVCKISNLCHCI